MSVDLVGSTAFKAGRGSETGKSSPQPAWVREIRDFYALFPAMLNRRFAERILNIRPDEREECLPPKLWKTVGDELIFCCQVRNLSHLATCILSFVLTLDDYGKILDARGKHLDVKGGAWLASFPYPNISVRVVSGQVDYVEQDNNLPLDEDLPTEDIEKDADKEPSEFDFLGPEIDGGFRVTKFATADRCALTVELACLVAEACHDDRTYPLKFFYHDRQIMKGVLRDKPYPVVSIDTERGASRKDVLSRERAVTKRDFAEPRGLHGFLTAFMRDERIEAPALAGVYGKAVLTLPSFYEKFRIAWTVAYEEAEQRRKTEDESIEQGDSTNVNGLIEETKNYKTINESFVSFLKGLDDADQR